MKKYILRYLPEGAEEHVELVLDSFALWREDALFNAEALEPDVKNISIEDAWIRYDEEGLASVTFSRPRDTPEPGE